MLGVGQDGCCGDTEMLSGSSGVNSCGVLAKITSRLFLSGLQKEITVMIGIVLLLHLKNPFD